MPVELSENRSAPGFHASREPAPRSTGHPDTRRITRSPMFEDRTYKRTFYSAPQSVTSLVAAFLEPSITVLTFLLVTLYVGEPVDRPALTLCLLVFALTFPGRNRFRENLIAAGVDIVSS